MITTIRSFALATVALAAFGTIGCASSRPLSEHAAALPVFKAEETHPAVIRTLGPVTTNVCLWYKNETSYVGDALNDLRSSADAKGASALIDFHYTMVARPPRVQSCQHFVQAEAVAVVLAGNGATPG